MQIEPMSVAEWPEVEAIYAEGIATGIATFEASPPSWEAFDKGRLPSHRFVARAAQGGPVLGWIAITPVSTREVYAGVVEHSIYVATAAAGQGVGRALLQTLIDSTEAAGIWTIQSGIFPENKASLALHRALGFRVVGTRERVGRMPQGPLAGQWCDVIALERRSSVIS